MSFDTRVLQVRAYLTPEENQQLTDEKITEAIQLLKELSWSPVGTARVIRSAISKGWLNNVHGF